MKKVVFCAVMLLILLSVTPVFASRADLINYPKVVYDYRLNNGDMSRITVDFDLNESITLSNGNSNIILEYFKKSNPNSILLTKNKSWGGYLNYYEHNCNGVHNVHEVSNKQKIAMDIPIVEGVNLSNDEKSNSGRIDMNQGDDFGVIITVLRTDGTGERVTVYSDGTALKREKIEKKVTDKDSGITLEASTGEVPLNIDLSVVSITKGSMQYNKIKDILPDADKFVAFQINILLNEVEKQPGGNVKLSIPIPSEFDSSKLMVYRIEDQYKIAYPVTVTIINNQKYATFVTDHFSTYVLSELSLINPPTGDINIVLHVTTSILSLLVIACVIVSYKKYQFW